MLAVASEAATAPPTVTDPLLIALYAALADAMADRADSMPSSALAIKPGASPVSTHLPAFRSEKLNLTFGGPHTLNFVDGGTPTLTPFNACVCLSVCLSVCHANPYLKIASPEIAT